MIQKIRLKDGLIEFIGDEVDNFIKEAGYKVDRIIIAWGTIGDNSKKVQEIQNQVLELLSEHKDKMQIICDPEEKWCIHSCCPMAKKHLQVGTVQTRGK